MDKAQCGDGITVLGLRSDVESDRSDCPPSKAAPLTAEAEDLAARVRRDHRASRASIERVVGKLGNLSQICPSLLLHLHAGYALAAAYSRVPRHGHRARLLEVRVRADSAVGRQFLLLLDHGVAALRGRDARQSTAAGCSRPASRGAGPGDWPRRRVTPHPPCWLY